MKKTRFYIPEKYGNDIHRIWYRLLDQNIHWFVSGNDLTTMLHIMRKTLGFKQTQFKISLLTADTDKYGILPLSLSKTSLYISVANLCDIGMLFQIPNTYPKIFRVDVPAIVDTVLLLFSGLDKSLKNAAIVLSHTLRDYYANEGFVCRKKLNIPKEKLMDIEKAVEAARAKNKTAKAEKVNKLKVKPLLVPANVQTLIEKFCMDAGVKFVLSGWTKKVRGCCKNFLAECVKDGKNPSDVLQEVCGHWHDIVASDVRRNGYELKLDSVFDFQEFFANRVAVFKCIEKNRESWKCPAKQPRVSVPDLGSLRKTNAEILKLKAQEAQKLKNKKLAEARRRDEERHRAMSGEVVYRD